MNENEVIQRVKQWLEAGGYTIDSVAQTHETGNDIEAHKKGKRLIIEAKGSTSSKPDSKDFGKPWGKTKLSHSLAQAILRAMEVIAHESVEVGIALPDVPYYRSTVQEIQGSLAACRNKGIFGCCKRGRGLLNGEGDLLRHRHITTRLALTRIDPGRMWSST